MIILFIKYKNIFYYLKICKRNKIQILIFFVTKKNFKINLRKIIRKEDNFWIIYKILTWKEIEKKWCKKVVAALAKLSYNFLKNKNKKIGIMGWI